MSRTCLILDRERQICQIRAIRVARRASQAQAGRQAGVAGLDIARFVSRTRREICCVTTLPGPYGRHWARGD